VWRALNVWTNSSCVLALERLDIVDQERIELPVSALEELRSVPSEGGDELGGEALGGRVVDGELRAPATQVVGDRA
jgi:hypothetical protein